MDKYLSAEEHEEVKSMVNEVLDKLFEGVKDDKPALLNLKLDMGIQDAQISRWRRGGNTPNMNTMFKLASKAGLRLCVVSKDAK